MIRQRPPVGHSAKAVTLALLGATLAALELLLLSAVWLVAPLAARPGGWRATLALSIFTGLMAALPPSFAYLASHIEITHVLPAPSPRRTEAPTVPTVGWR